MSILGNNLLAQYYAQNMNSIPTKGLVFYAPLIDKANAETGQTINYISSCYTDEYKGVKCLSNAAYNSSTVLSFSLPDVFSGGSVSYSIWWCCRESEARQCVLLRLGNDAVVKVTRPNCYIADDSVYNQVQKDTWYNLILVFNENVVYVYINGELVGNITYSLEQASNAVSIGADNNTSYLFSWSNIRIYNRVLTNNEIKSISKELSPTP